MLLKTMPRKVVRWLRVVGVIPLLEAGCAVNFARRTSERFDPMGSKAPESVSNAHVAFYH
jgi:hypothetical protein